jgi:hypothetical protein
LQLLTLRLALPELLAVLGKVYPQLLGLLVVQAVQPLPTAVNTDIFQQTHRPDV